MECTISKPDDIPSDEVGKNSASPATAQHALPYHYALSGSETLQITVDFRRSEPNSVISGSLSPRSYLLDCSLLDVLASYKTVSRKIFITIDFRKATEEIPILKAEQKAFIELLARTLKSFSQLGIHYGAFQHSGGQQRTR